MDEPLDLEALVARVIRRAIALDGRSLNAVGRAAGFSQGYLSQLLRGRQDLKLQHVARILAALDLAPADFFRRIVDALVERSGSVPSGRRPELGAGSSPRSAAAEASPRHEDGAAGASRRADLRETIRQVVQEVVRQELRAERAAVAESGRAAGPGAGGGAVTAGTPVGTIAEVGEALAGHLRGRSFSGGGRELEAVRGRRLVGLADFLAEEARRAGFRDVVLAQELAELSVEVADALDPALYPPSVVHDRRALSRAFLGNARRVASDLFGAERAFQDALYHLEKGSGNEIARADVLSLLGSLRTDQARYPEARRVLEEALQLYRQVRQRPDEGKVLLKLAKACGGDEEPERAVAMIDEAIPLVDAECDERLRLLARHGQIGWLVDAGDPLEALARFEKAQDLYDRFRDDPWFQLRRVWQEAYIHAALGDLARAEALFEEVRQAATERELPYELAMVNLELAALHLEQGNTARVRELAEEMVPIFRSRELHAHAMAAVYLFQHAARTATATSGLAKEVLQYLRRAQNNPYLPFR